MTDPLDLDALRAVLAKATPGVPEIVRYDDVSSDINYQLHFSGGDINVREGDFENRTHAKATAAAIVALMNAAPRMLAELEAAREVVRVAKIGALDIANSWLDSTLSAYDAATKGGG